MPSTEDPLSTSNLISPSISPQSSMRMREKQKTLSLSARMCQAMRSRYLLVGVTLVLVGYFGLSWESSDISGLLSYSPFTPSPDRSEAYNVKVLPASLSDDDLNKLPKETFSYLAMIDAGSSGCRAHVYRYGKLGTLTGPLYVLPQHDSKKVKPGLSTFASHPQDAGKSLAGLIDFMKEQVPEADWAVTPIWLKATAGLRMLKSSESDAVLASVRKFLLDRSNSPFLFRPSYARIIPGIEEGGFGWIAFNYLKRIIGPKRDPESKETPYAVVEMGGASSQVSQQAPDAKSAQAIPQEYRFSFTIEQDTYHLYTHSYLGYGAEQGREQLNKKLMAQAHHGDSSDSVKDPCLNTGYSRPASTPVTQPYEGPKSIGVSGASSSNPKMCAVSLMEIFRDSSSTSAPECAQKPTPLPVSFGCVHQPDFVAASPNFLVFENFFYTTSALAVPSVTASTGIGNINTTYTMSQAAQTAPAQFPLQTTPNLIKSVSDVACQMDWSTLQATYPRDKQDKDVDLKLCFSSAYAYSFLVDGLKLPKDKVITIQKEVGSSEIEWALGAAYKEAAELLKRTHLRPT